MEGSRALWMWLIKKFVFFYHAVDQCCQLNTMLRCLRLRIFSTFLSSIVSSFQEWAYTMARRPSSVRLSVNFCANRFFSQANSRIATKLAHVGLQVSLHPGCAQGQGQGQGQKSFDTRTFFDSWNELLRHWRSGARFSKDHKIWIWIIIRLS